MAEKKKKCIELIVSIPDNVKAKKEGNLLTIKGPKGECKRVFAQPILTVEVKEKVISLSTKTSTKEEKKKIYANEEHIKNMIIGVTEGHSYILKVCTGHFPMTVTATQGQLVVKNFLGEKFPRTLKLKQGVTVKVEGDKINISCPDKDLAGTTASDIEQLTKRPGFDTRIFQDGLYIINKDGKEIK
jgi:large subunit ribosomal protein L6